MTNQATDQEKLFPGYRSDKGLVARVTMKSYNSINKRPNSKWANYLNTSRYFANKPYEYLKIT